MRRCRPWFFVVLLSFPYVTFAQEEVCSDPAKVLIGFGILVSVFLSILCVMILIMYFSLGGRKYLKKLGFALVLSLLFGVMSVTAGLVKEYSRNTIPFLHPACLEEGV